ncbi:hypothetical protein ACPA9J_04040 [Pseudomonas aeruginosa]
MQRDCRDPAVTASLAAALGAARRQSRPRCFALPAAAGHCAAIPASIPGLSGGAARLRPLRSWSWAAAGVSGFPQGLTSNQLRDAVSQYRPAWPAPGVAVRAERSRRLPCSRSPWPAGGHHYYGGYYGNYGGWRDPRVRPWRQLPGDPQLHR